MSSLEPVDPSYSPGYPARLSQREIDEHLRPGLLQRFGAKVLHAGAALGGAAVIAAGGMGQAHAELAAGSTPGSIQPGPELDKQVTALIKRLRGPGNSGIHPKATPVLTRELEANPFVKHPRIQVHFGNSYMGLIDTNAAKAATKQLFSLYGIDLRDDVHVKSGGYEFDADGYDPVTKTGFEIIEPRLDTGAAKASAILTDDELRALDVDVKAGRARFFVTRSEHFPVVDIDRHASWTYYLEAVAEYLRWIHGRR